MIGKKDCRVVKGFRNGGSGVIQPAEMGEDLICGGWG